jgi:hypothetical protein
LKPHEASARKGTAETGFQNALIERALAMGQSIDADAAALFHEAHVACLRVAFVRVFARVFVRECAQEERQSREACRRAASFAVQCRAHYE